MSSYVKFSPLLPALSPYDKIISMSRLHTLAAAPKPRLVPWPLLVITLLGFALRLFRLGSQSLWYDETVSAYLASLPPAELIAHTARDIHPPGYYLALHLWQTIAGRTEFALAFFSLLFGVLLIPLTFQLARWLINPATATWAALLIATSPYHIWYSQEVRMYTLGAACGLVAAGCALRGLNSRRWRWWAGYVTASAVGLYALYYFSFLLIALNLLFLAMVLWPAPRRQPLTRLLVANALLALAYLPWLPIAWRQATNPPVPPWRSLPAPAETALTSWSALSLGQSVQPEAAWVWPLLLLTLALTALGVVYSRPQVAAFLLTYSFGPALLIYGLSLITPLYHVRYLFTFSPAFYVLLAAGLSFLATRMRFWTALLAATILLAASAGSIYQYHFNPRYQADDFRAAVAFLDHHWQPGDALLANAGYTYTAVATYSQLPGLERRRLVPYRPPEQPGAPLLLQTGTVGGSSQLGWGNPAADFYAMSPAETLAALEQLAADYPRLWLLRAYDTVTDPDGLIRDWLAGHAIPLEDQPFAGESNIRVQGYLLAAPPPPPGSAIPFKDGVRLLGWQLPGQPWQAGQTIPVKLWWQADAPPTADYKLSLKLWQADGTLAAQGEDEWPGGALYRATRWQPGEAVYHPAAITLPASLPPGQYWLNAELYHPDTIQPLPRADDGSTVVTLGPVTVN